MGLWTDCVFPNVGKDFQECSGLRPRRRQPLFPTYILSFDEYRKLYVLLRHCASSLEVPVSILSGVLGNFEVI